MKCEIKSLRGNLDAGRSPPVPESIFHYDGTDLTRGWKIKEIYATQEGDESASNPGVIFHTDPVAKRNFDLSDNQIIGWAGSSFQPQVLDPNHIIVGDLYATNLSSEINSYLVVLEEITIEKAMNVIYRLKERAQSTLDSEPPY